MLDTPPLGNVPPQNLEAEQSVLGSMMIDRQALEAGIEMLVAEDFYRPAHQTVFEALAQCAQGNTPADLITLQEELRRRKKLEDIGNTEYLMSLVESVPTSANLEYYARIVVEKATMRRVISKATELIGMAMSEESGTVERFAEYALDITRTRGLELKSMTQVSESVYKTLDGYYHGVREFGVPWRLSGLNDLTYGVQENDFVIIGARPSEGKSVLGSDILFGAAANQVPALVFSQEMSAESIGMRMTASGARFDLRAAREGKITDEEWKRIVDQCGDMYHWPVMFRDKSVTINRLCSMVRHWVLQNIKPNHFGIVVVDYLQIVDLDRRATSSTEAAKEISRKLKSLAQDYPIGLVALSQLTRMNKREKRKPDLSDLRDSGAIEAEADKVLLIDNPPTRPTDENGRRACTIDVAKHRNGGTGQVKAYFTPTQTRFDECDDRWEEPVYTPGRRGEDYAPWNSSDRDDD